MPARNLAQIFWSFCHHGSQGSWQACSCIHLLLRALASHPQMRATSSPLPPSSFLSSSPLSRCCAFGRLARSAEYSEFGQLRRRPLVVLRHPPTPSFLSRANNCFAPRLRFKGTNFLDPPTARSFRRDAPHLAWRSSREKDRMILAEVNIHFLSSDRFVP